MTGADSGRRVAGGSPGGNPVRPRMVVGLGNPGRDYARTRHNLGFMVLDHMAEAFGLPWADERKWSSRLARWSDAGVVLVQPQTYMNLVGEAVGPLARYLRIVAGEVLVVTDDVDLPWGKLRLRPAGGAGGHNGLKSLIAHLGTDQFPRLKVGIGRPPPDGRETSDHVLGRLSPEEEDGLAMILDRAILCVRASVDRGLEAAMAAFNSDDGQGRNRPATGAGPKRGKTQVSGSGGPQEAGGSAEPSKQSNPS